MSAARNGRTERVAALLDAKSFVDQTEAGGKSALLVAAFNGHVDCLRLLLQWRADVNQADSSERSALCLSSQRGHDEACALLLDANASVNAHDQDGDSPLHVAAEDGHLSVVELLLLAKADVNGLDGRGRSALYGACSQTHRVKLAMALIEARAEVNKQDRDGNTPLHSASLRRGRGLGDHGGSAKLVARLLLEGADPFIANHSGRTAFTVASEGGRDELLELLSNPRVWSTAAHGNLKASFRRKVVALVTVPGTGGAHDIVESLSRAMWDLEWSAMVAAPV